VISIGVLVGNLNKKRELQYLLEDLVKDLSKLPDDIYGGPYEQDLVDQLNQKLAQLHTIHIGQAKVLDSIQYLIGELRIGMDEWEKSYSLMTKMIDDIQDFLDWEDAWK
jgi:hypothetical protein